MEFTKDIIAETLRAYDIDVDVSVCNNLDKRSIKDVTSEFKDIDSMEGSAAQKHAYGEFAICYADDDRAGVRKLVERSINKISALVNEEKRVHALYVQQNDIAGGKIAIGCDEVGRGPLAGPLTIGAVVLDYSKSEIMGINDSKQLSAKKREELAEAIKRDCLVYSIQHISPQFIDENGMTASLKKAFSDAIADIDRQMSERDWGRAEVVLLDGNPLHLDPRETSVVKGDAKCAAISCASIIAKVERDGIMEKMSEEYPGYGWEHNAGYGSQDHMDAIREKGLTPHHRRSFCKNIC